MAKSASAEKGMIFLDNFHPILVETLSDILGVSGGDVSACRCFRAPRARAIRDWTR